MAAKQSATNPIDRIPKFDLSGLEPEHRERVLNSFDQLVKNDHAQAMSSTRWAAIIVLFCLAGTVYLAANGHSVFGGVLAGTVVLQLVGEFLRRRR